MQFLLINVVKFNVFLNTAQTQSTMCRNCFSFDQNATLQFSRVAVLVSSQVMQQVSRHNLRVHLQSKCVQIQSVLIKCER